MYNKITQINNLEIKNVNTLKKGHIEEFIQKLEERIKLMEAILVIDRFEEIYAVCEDKKNGQIVNIERQRLPSGVKEGNVIKYQNGKYIIDTNIENEIQNRINKKMDKLWNN